MRRVKICIAMVLPLLLAACAAAPRSDGGCALSQGTSLYFGRDIENTAEVSEADWAAFLDETVRPQFPGHTVYDATGYWQGTSEKTKVLSVYHDGDSATSEALTEIAEDYRRRFRQGSVLRADYDACVTFVGD